MARGGKVPVPRTVRENDSDSDLSSDDETPVVTPVQKKQLARKTVQGKFTPKSKRAIDTNPPEVPKKQRSNTLFTCIGQGLVAAGQTMGSTLGFAAQQNNLHDPLLLPGGGQVFPPVPPPAQAPHVDLTNNDSDDDVPQMNFASQRPTVNADIGNLAPVTYKLDPTWKVLADASPNGRPPISSVFDPTEINPYTKKPLIHDVKRAVKIAKEIRDLPLDGVIDNVGASYNNSSGSADQTKDAVVINLIALLVCCSCQTFGAKNWGSISISFLEDKAKRGGAAAMAFHQQWVVNLLIYILEYIMDPYWRARYADIKYRNLKSARNYLIRADKLRRPLWSHGYIESGAFGRNTSDMMKGMNYYVAVLADKLVLGGLEKGVNKHFKGKPKDHYLLEKELTVMFNVNEGKRLWDAEMVSEPERSRGGDEGAEGDA